MCEFDRTQRALTNSNVSSNTQVCKVESSVRPAAFSRTPITRFSYPVGALDRVSTVSTHNCAIPHRRYGEPSTGNHRRPRVRFRNSQVCIAGTKILDPPIPLSTFPLRSIPFYSLSRLERWSLSISPDPYGIASYTRTILFSYDARRPWIEPANIDMFFDHFLPSPESSGS